MKILHLVTFFNFIIIICGLAISPKLDFPEKSSVVEVKRGIKEGKIKGLRVTVDTSELKESKDSDSDSSGSSDSSSERKTKKTVGVRTDVTFEITSGESSNDTKTVDDKEIGKEDDNASINIVPVFKGLPDRGGSSKAIDSSYNEILSVIPLENPSPNTPRVPNYRDPQSNTRHDDFRNRYGNSGDNENGWKIFPQYEIWTTERNSHNNHNDLHNQRRFNQHPAIYHHHNSGGQFDIHKRPPFPPSSFVPYQADRHDQHRPSWKTCDCKEYPGPHIVGVQPLPTPTSQDDFKIHTNKIDDKLERPFSKTTK